MRRAFSTALGGQWRFAAFVPGYSGGAAPDSHRIPCSIRTRGSPTREAYQFRRSESKKIDRPAWITHDSNRPARSLTHPLIPV